MNENTIPLPHGVAVCHRVGEDEIIVFPDDGNWGHAADNLDAISANDGRLAAYAEWAKSREGGETTYREFLDAHGLCSHCRGSGLKPHDAWGDRGFAYRACKACRGSGKKA